MKERRPKEPRVVLMMGPTEFSPPGFGQLMSNTYLFFIFYLSFPSALTFFPTKTNFTTR